jgi:protein-S-isoprenylcysteine O-methyltransferase Ste14
MGPARGSPPPPGLWLRSLLSALLLPGVVAGLLPWLVSRGSLATPLSLGAWRWLGLLPLALGLFTLAATIVEFAVVGRGTLAPWDAPRHLVSSRLYHWVRNPMYLGVLGIQLGLGLLLGLGGVLGLTVLTAMLFHARVVAWEEPTLGRLFGQQFDSYRQAVPRWVPRRPEPR